MKRGCVVLCAVAVGSGCFSEDPVQGGGPETSGGSTQGAAQTTGSDGSTGAASAEETTQATDVEDGTGSSTDAGGSESTTTGATPGSRVILFYGPQVAGDLDAQSEGDIRGFVDVGCEQKRDALGLDCQTTHAVMSTSPTDTVAQLGAEYGMPFDVPVHGPTERLIADGFGLMLGEGVMLLQTLRAAAVPGTSPSNQWWSGTDENGALANTACADWTDAGDTAMGNVGSATEADSAWLNDFAGACATAMPVLCACW